MKNFFAQMQMLMRIYSDCLQKTVQYSLRNGHVLFTLFAYFGIFYLISFLTAPLGIVGGFILGFTMDACVSSFLAMVETIVKRQKLRLEEFKKSFFLYFFDVMGVFFVYWIVSLVLTPLAQAGQAWLVLGVKLAMFILFNPMPELIYYGRYGTLEIFAKAYEFIRDNWVEWFLPNILLGVAIYFLINLSFGIPFEFILKAVIYAFFLYFFMIFRGLLFESLHRSSKRMRLFQYRAQS